MAQTSIKDLTISGSILRKRIWIILQSKIIIIKKTDYGRPSRYWMLLTKVSNLQMSEKGD